MLRKLIFTATLLMVAMYTINGLFLAFSQPGNLQAGEPERVSESFGNYNIVVFDELQSGGVPVLGLSIEAAGYVNMLSTVPVSSGQPLRSGRPCSHCCHPDRVTFDNSFGVYRDTKPAGLRYKCRAQ